MNINEINISSLYWVDPNKLKSLSCFCNSFHHISIGRWFVKLIVTSCICRLQNFIIKPNSLLCCDVNTLIISTTKIKEAEGGASCDDGRGVDRVTCLTAHSPHEVERHSDCASPAQREHTGHRPPLLDFQGWPAVPLPTRPQRTATVIIHLIFKTQNVLMH